MHISATVKNSPASDSYLLVEKEAQYRLMLNRLQDSLSPLALDTERMDGKYFHNRVCLLQICTPESEAFLIDTLALTELTDLQHILRNREWILHSASNDLPYLTELGFTTSQIFDTQLAAEICGYEKLGLGFLIEKITGKQISKEHQRERWDRRPIPQSWLEYAANDVLYLHQLKDSLSKELELLKRKEWCDESCAAVVENYSCPPSQKTWLDIRGEVGIKNPKNRAALKALYSTLSKVAERRNIPTHFLLKDKDLVTLAKTLPASPKDSVYHQIKTPQMARTWQRAINQALKLPAKYWPAAAVPKQLEDISGISRWRERDPYRAELLLSIRQVLEENGRDLGVKPEVLLPAQQQRFIAAHWQPGEDLALLMLNAKALSWQVNLLLERIHWALKQTHQAFLDNTPI